MTQKREPLRTLKNLTKIPFLRSPKYHFKINRFGVEQNTVNFILILEVF